MNSAKRFRLDNLRALVACFRLEKSSGLRMTRDLDEPGHAVILDPSGAEVHSGPIQNTRGYSPTEPSRLHWLCYQLS